MKKLTAFEILNLRMGIEEEVKTDFRLHEHEQHETLKLLTQYVEMLSFPETFSELDKEILVSTLRQFSDFWINYFDLGQRVALEKYEEASRHEGK